MNASTVAPERLHWPRFNQRPRAWMMSGGAERNMRWRRSWAVLFFPGLKEIMLERLSVMMRLMVRLVLASSCARSCSSLNMSNSSCM